MAHPLVEFTARIFFKNNDGKKGQFLILIPRHPRRCEDVRKVEKSEFC